VDSPLTDYSGENTNDTDIALIDDAMEKKYAMSPDALSGKSLSTKVSVDGSVKKWINEVTSTQPCLNAVADKVNSIDSAEEDKDSIEIDKEVETVLQSGTIVESLSITTDNLNTVSNEPHTCKGNCYCYCRF
jgi:alkyl hydroperoxide reductase subunit AhpF